MIQKKPWALRLLALSGLLAGVALCSAKAIAGTCELNPTTNPLGSQPIIATMPLLGANLTVGRDLPVGSEIYRQTFMPATSTILHCVNLTAQPLERDYFTATPLPLSAWMGAPYGGKTYETGVAGVGVVIWFRNDVLPYTWSMANCDTMMANCGVNSAPGNMALVVSLIKTGNVAAGVINGANFPSVIRDIVTDNVLPVLRLNFSGAINIVSRTCTTPDVPVPLGSYRVSELGGVGNGTPWQEFDIQLLNCPAFHGYFSNSGPQWSNNGNTLPGTRTNNAVNFRLDPVNGVIDAANGVMSLNNSAPGDAPAATGIGIQIARRTEVPVPLGTMVAGFQASLTPVEGASFSIPLQARYLQTQGTVTPGPANGAAVFTLDYL